MAHLWKLTTWHVRLFCPILDSSDKYVSAALQQQHVVRIRTSRETKTTPGETEAKEPEGGEENRLTLVSNDDSRRSVADLKTAVGFFL